LDALCKKHTEDVQKLREEKAKLEGMVKSRDELIMEFTDKYGYNRNDEDADDENEDDDNRGDVGAPLAAAPPPVPVPPAVAPEVIIVDEEDRVEMVPEKEAPEAHEVILTDAELELPQPWLYIVLMRDYKESLLRMMDDPHELEHPTEDSCDVGEWFPEDGSNDQDWVIESSLKI
jgi:hypothetical protein